jgi:hypothetical protein
MSKKIDRPVRHKAFGLPVLRAGAQVSSQEIQPYEVAHLATDLLGEMLLGIAPQDTRERTRTAKRDESPTRGGAFEVVKRFEAPVEGGAKVVTSVSRRLSGDRVLYRMVTAREREGADGSMSRSSWIGVLDLPAMAAVEKAAMRYIAEEGQKSPAGPAFTHGG